MADRVCFVSSRPGFVRDHNTFQIDWANGRLIESLHRIYADRFSIAFFSDAKLSSSYNQSITVSHIYELPFPFTQWGGFRNTLRILKILKRIEKENDLLIIQLPILGFLSLFFIKKPILFHVCANVLTAANNPVKYRGIMKFAAAGYARCIVVFNKFVFKRSNVRVIVNGSELRALYARFNPVAAVSSSITSTDIAPVDSVQLPRNGQFGLLFVGRPSLEKGFDILIDALLEFKFEFTLTVIGFSSDEFRAMLPAYYSKSHSIHHRLKFLGYLNWGEEFKGVLRSNSVLVVPSRSEGTPRVILEAMSQGLPTVASRIGGIPDVVSHGESGLLFTAGSATALYDTLVAFRNNVEQQKLMRFKCLDVAKRNTIDQFADIFVKTIKDLEK